LFLRVCLGLTFYVFIRFSLDYFVIVLFAFAVLGLVSSIMCREIGTINVSEMTYFVLNGV